MNLKTDHPDAMLQYLRLLLITCLALSFLYLLTIAWNLSLDFFDSFQIFGNARHLLGYSGTEYTHYRPVLSTLLYLPSFLGEKLFLTSQWTLPFAHIQALVFYFLWLISLYFFFRFSLDKTTALLGLFLFALNPLIIHYAPFAKEDIPAALFTTLAFVFYLQHLKSQQQRYAWGFGLFSALGMLTRYNLIPLLFLVILIHWFCLRFLAKRKDTCAVSNSTRSLIALYLFPVLLFLLLPLLLFSWLDLSYFSPINFIEQLITQLQDNRQGYREPYVYLIFLIKSVSPAIILTAVIAIIHMFWKKHTELLLPFIWLMTFFLFHLFFIPGKEARYLFPLLPPLYLFALHGIKLILKSIQKARRAQAALTILFLILLMGFPLWRGLREYIHFSDPIYRTDYAKTVSHHALNLSKKNRILWVGSFYPLHPRSFIFDANDDYTYLYHFFSHVVGYYTEQSIYTVAFPRFTSTGEDNTPLLTGIGRYANDGDVLIINQEKRSYRTSNLPSTLAPLEVGKVVVQKYSLKKENQKMGTEHVQFLKKDNFFQFNNLPSGKYEIYLVSPQRMQSLGWKNIVGGKLQLEALSSYPMENIAEVWLLSLTEKKLFPWPQSSGNG